MRITYVTLQATSQGQAAHAHVHEIIDGLRGLGETVELHQVRYGNRITTTGRLWQAVRAQWSALRNLRGSDIIYVRQHFLTFPIVWIAAWMRIPIVVEVNGTFSDALISYPRLKSFSGLVGWAQDYQFRRADLVICVTSELASWVERRTRGKTQTVVVSNGANTRLFDPERALKDEPLIELPQSFVVFFGALSKWQGVSTMLEATLDSRWPPQVCLVLIGDGADRSKVESAANAFPERVKYFGQRGYDEIPGIVARSRGSLIIKEGPFHEGGLLPLKLYESLAMQVPVVVTDYPGIRDVVSDNGFGIVIPPGDPRQLACAVNELLNWNQEKSVQARAWTVDGNSWEARAKQTRAHLEMLKRLVP